VLVYASVESTPFHKVARELLDNLKVAGTELWISRQIIREYLVAISHPGNFSKPASSDQAAAQVEALIENFRVADETAAVTSRLLALLREIPAGGKQIHDANIVATMLAYHIPTLITHNVRDFARYREKVTLQALVSTD
jgi:predicted nucleic acid-binding protein